MRSMDTIPSTKFSWAGGKGAAEISELRDFVVGQHIKVRSHVTQAEVIFDLAMQEKDLDQDTVYWLYVSRGLRTPIEIKIFND